MQIFLVSRVSLPLRSGIGPTECLQRLDLREIRAIRRKNIRERLNNGVLRSARQIETYEREREREGERDIRNVIMILDDVLP